MIQSMTAFARTTGQDANLIATWEIRVVNHRYCDCTIKLPEPLRHLEVQIRQRLQQTLQRGKIECFLKVNSPHNVTNEFILNRPLVAELIGAVEEIKIHLPTANIDPLKVLSWPQVLRTAEFDPETSQPLIEELFDQTLQEIVTSREREGTLLAQLIGTKLQQILKLVDKIKKQEPQILARVRNKFEKQLSEITVAFDQNRLEQELVYLMQKLDVTEELDRLTVHTKETMHTLTQEGAVGKKLDFLIQELHREANTLTAKSGDLEITQNAIELKVLIEQIREQVQNIL